MKSYISLFVLILTSCCSTKLDKMPEQAILLFRDNDGIYQHELLRGTEKCIFNKTDASELIFLDEPATLTNNVLSFRIKGEHRYAKEEELYSENYYSINLDSAKPWVSKIITYKVSNRKSLNISSTDLYPDGSISSQTDTTVVFLGSSSSSRGVRYNDFKPRFFSQSTVKDKSVFSQRGSVYLIENSDTTELVKFQGHFDPKFGSGYYQPVLNPTAEYAVLRYLPGFLNYKESSSLQKIDVKTKVKTILKKGEYANYSFSDDGQFLLFSRDGRFNENDYWVYDIYILDLSSLKQEKIGVASYAIWSNELHN